MKKHKRSIYGAIFFYFPDIMLIISYIIFKEYAEEYRLNINDYIPFGLFLFLVIRSLMFYLICKYFYFDRVKLISGIISEFRKGRVTTSVTDISGFDRFAKVLRDLITVVRSLDTIVSNQRDEIDTFHEFYESIVFSINSLFIILDNNEKIAYANEGFCKKFKFDPDEIVGKSVEELFYFVNARLKGAILKAKSRTKPVILKQTHLLSISRISIISDVKVTKIKIKDKEQIAIILDDVTSKLRKDYQISLISHLSESFQSDLKIDKLMYIVLTSVTSGTGLGFNRAMLFLADDKKEYLAGKMAVGPDSFEEAIEIWNSIDESNMFNDDSDKLIESKMNRFYKSVLEKNFSIKDPENIFVKSYLNKEIIYVHDSWNDETVNREIKEFMDVKEFVIAPIISLNKAIGLIIVDNKFNQVPIGSDSIELLKTFTSQAALTLESQNNLILVKKEMQKIEKRQEGIIESEKMAAVGRLAAHISHEIRNPLVTMGGYARRIIQMSKMDDVNKMNLQKFGSIIHNESERLEKILSNVMDFTKPSKFIKEFNNINEIIDDTVNLLSNIFLERNIEIITRYNNNIPLVKSDFNQLKQVILNLLQNSLEVTSANGIIELITESDPENVIIRVKDTGTGINEPDPNIVFEPFYTKKISGVGLGLTNVKKIIGDHNGEIKVRNREFGGVEFKILLPLLE